MDKKLMTEEDIKLQFITPAITSKWSVSQITMETKITDGRINLQGNKVSREKAKNSEQVFYMNDHEKINVQGEMFVQIPHLEYIISDYDFPQKTKEKMKNTHFIVVNKDE